MKCSIGWRVGWLWVVLVLTAFAVILVGQVKLPEGEGKQLVEDTCALSCHGPESWSELRMGKEDWDPLVRDMASRGEAKSEKELELMVNYLAKNFGPEKASEPAPNTDKPAQ